MLRKGQTLTDGDLGGEMLYKKQEQKPGKIKIINWNEERIISKHKVELIL